MHKTSHQQGFVQCIYTFIGYKQMLCIIYIYMNYTSCYYDTLPYQA